MYAPRHCWAICVTAKTDKTWVALTTVSCLARIFRYRHDMTGLRNDQDELQKKLVAIQVEMKSAKEAAQEKVDTLQQELQASKVRKHS